MSINLLSIISYPVLFRICYYIGSTLR